MSDAISWIIVLFILISIGTVVIGFILFLAKLFSPKKEETKQNTKTLVRAEKGKRHEIKCTPFIEGLVGIEIIEQTKKENGDLHIGYYVFNLSESVASFEVLNAFYVTSQGEQVRGSVAESVRVSIYDFDKPTEELENNVILPSLKVKKKVYFYDKNIEPNYSDILLVRIKCFGQVHLLSTFVFK